MSPIGLLLVVHPSISPAAPKQPVIHSRIMVMSVRGTNTTGNSRVKGEEGKQWPLIKCPKGTTDCYDAPKTRLMAQQSVI